MADLEGIVFDIREWCLHDGPGIRTTVFLKGCPLRCLWCSNPEGQDAAPLPLPSHDRCHACAACQHACPQHCIPSPGALPDNACTGCGACVSACPARRLRMVGQRITVSQLTERLLRDAPLLQRSHGGITFSGGEPLAQPAFLLAMLERLSPLHLAIETSGFASEDHYRQMLDRISLVLQDIKCADDALHRRLTGVSNECIWRNIDQLRASGIPYFIRMPLIPGFNDSTDDLRITAQRLAKSPGNLLGIHLLPYQSVGSSKYQHLHRTYKIPHELPPLNLDILHIFHDASLPASWPFGETIA